MYKVIETKTGYSFPAASYDAACDLQKNLRYEGRSAYIKKVSKLEEEKERELCEREKKTRHGIFN